MPKYIRGRSIQIDHYRKVKTLGDRIREFGQGLVGFVLILLILGWIAG